MKKFLIVILILAVLASGAYFLVPKEKPISEDVSINAETVYPQVENLKRNKDFVSRIMPENSAVVMALIPDNIIETTKNVGDTVKKGELLFRIDPSTVKEQVDLALAALDLQQAQINQSEGSSKKISLLSKELQLKSAKLQYDTAFDELKLWKSELESQLDALDEEISSLEKADPTSPKLAELKSKRRSVKAKYEAERETKKLNLKNQGIALNNAQKAYDLENELISAEEKAINDATLAKSRADYEKAIFYLEKANVTSPISGVVEFKGIKTGEKPDQKTPAYIISNKNLMSVSFGIPDTFIHEIGIGDKAEIDYNGKILDGVISEISLSADQKSGLYSVKALCETDGSVLSGTTVIVSIAAQKSNDALTVPPESIFFDEEEAYVFTLENGKAVKNSVILGIVTSDSAEITAGLTKDDLVIKTNSPKIANGVKINDISGNAFAKEPQESENGSTATADETNQTETQTKEKEEK